MLPNTKKSLPESVIRLKDQYYILASSPLLEVRTRVLKHDETFAVFDRYGDIQPIGLGEQGIYHEGTRYLSRLMINLNGERPLLLSSTVRSENALLTVDLTNPDVSVDGQMVQPRSTLHIFRTKFIWQKVCYERLRIWNYGLVPADVFLSLTFDADFADVFEVRGVQRDKRGTYLRTKTGTDYILFGYKGLDGVTRRTRIRCFPQPQEIQNSRVDYRMQIKPQLETNVVLAVGFESEKEITPLSYDDAFAEASNSIRLERIQSCRISSSNQQFDVWTNRSVVDLHMMLTETNYGLYPYAGVPWFSTPFGRDGIITAWECLWFNPAIAKGVLAYLAATQATETNDQRDAQPGKILHEQRDGEMPALNEVPFGCYYGSVDSTPLFIMLAGAYFECTGDREFVAQIWPHVDLALQWIDKYGDSDGDGFIEYFRKSDTGLIQQGWKDSNDAVFHADGSLAQGPIALCEVQGYVYQAKLKAALLASVLGMEERASNLIKEAEVLRERFESVFWCEELSMYALALDGDKRPCRVRTSNAGHALFTGIASPQRAVLLTNALFHELMFSGWGIRTVGASEARYNPMSYHNGSIWPHDNAMIAQGLANYQFKEHAVRLCEALFETSLYMDLNRLPELFCGFIRRPNEGPTLYPVACAPQSWAAASIFLLLQACLGLSIQATASQLVFKRPLLPEFLQVLRIRNLRVAEAAVDLEMIRYDSGVGINVLRRHGDVQVITLK